MRPVITPRWLQQAAPLRNEQTEVLTMGIFGFIAMYSYTSEPVEILFSGVIAVVFAGTLSISVGLLWMFEFTDRNMNAGATPWDVAFDSAMVIILLSMPAMALLTVVN